MVLFDDIIIANGHILTLEGKIKELEAEITFCKAAMLAMLNNEKESEMSYEKASYLAVKDCNDKEQWRLLEFDSMDELRFAIRDKEAQLYQILKQCEYKILQEVKE